MNNTSKHYEDIHQKLTLIEQYGALSCNAALELVKDLPHCHTHGRRWELVTWIDLEGGVIYDVYYDGRGMEYTTYEAQNYFRRFVKQQEGRRNLDEEDLWLLEQMRTRPDIYTYVKPEVNHELPKNA